MQIKHKKSKILKKYYIKYWHSHAVFNQHLDVIK